MVSVSKLILIVALLFGCVSAFSTILRAKAERRLPKTEVDVEFTVSGEDKDPAKALEKAQAQAKKLS